MDYIKVNIEEYVKEGLENGTLNPIVAEKYARIIAYPGKVGTQVITWSVDSEGREIKEKVAEITLDPKTNNPGWVVTKSDENGYPILDSNGHLNEWIIDDSTFRKKYEADEQFPEVFKSKGGPQIFVQIHENIILNQWGSDMQIAAGGYINITNPDDIYGISQRDFEDTYKIVDQKERSKQR